MARSAEKLLALAKQIGEAQAVPVEGDVTRQSDNERAVAAAIERFGRLDVVFANAGSWNEGPIAQGDPEEWAAVIDVNILGALRTIRAALPGMIERKSGQILVTASIAGRAVYPGSVVYAATKHAIYAIVEGLRKEVCGDGISVGAISPGMVMNEFWGDEFDRKEWDRRVGEGTALLSENIASAVVWMLSQPAHVNVADLLVLGTRQEVPSL
jgi:NADP-dependent 3-hydroxy acid dehydrogenase YdfG